jgi:hypothetical protein
MRVGEAVVPLAKRRGRHWDLIRQGLAAIQNSAIFQSMILRVVVGFIVFFVLLDFLFYF